MKFKPKWSPPIIRIGAFAAVTAVVLLFGLSVHPIAGNNDIATASISTPKKLISLTFDTALGEDYTGSILDILDEEGVKATFFILGAWADEHPAEVSEIARRGHELANHGYTHKNMASMKMEDARIEMKDCSEAIKRLSGQEAKLFRAPYGYYTGELAAAAREMGLLPVAWSIDALDWKEKGENFVLDNVISQAGSGDIILFQTCTEDGARALQGIIKRLKANGYILVKLSALIEAQYAR
ncbi:MAG: polysaccharide deacetylase family protein [Bacillota bacterium]|nr:polysaccharide deacetylase family protein [Bacillota bacterium]